MLLGVVPLPFVLFWTYPSKDDCVCLKNKVSALQGDRLGNVLCCFIFITISLSEASDSVALKTLKYIWKNFLLRLFWAGVHKSLALLMKAETSQIICTVNILCKFRNWYWTQNLSFWEFHFLHWGGGGASSKALVLKAAKTGLMVHFGHCAGKVGAASDKDLASLVLHSFH